ncbi:glycosyl transferase family 90 [Kingella kingae]|uniref:glycosyl transferase family 90 n=1 Tax=Kingella kingae TaxID=504 RepID=UPI0004154B9D|nr:glycosyl transferase family 90 [Kingella kingae]MDK4625218.1 glycosyl transferase family 90 [Kingella kingae]MDK4650482.1 glycosyl transferase family 90 [Kingella kingae]MDK4660901.1 glycosyl transferase family 90 [Kingella kingae]MDK4668398.1 glycosyl transferase family 90 [Kingella kingae]MDK4686496.1 glycosyl transferase family 90 [Kingella kingae]
MNDLHRRLHKLSFYLRHIHLGVLPYALKAKDVQAALREFRLLPAEQQQHVQSRVDYYNKLSLNTALTHAPQETVGAYHRCPDWNSSYFYDLADLVRYFPADYAFDCEFGDVIHVPKQPAFVKSRPIQDDNQHSVLLKLDSFRHFYVYPDALTFSSKRNQLVWRGAAHQPWRLKFVQQYHNHPLCDVGCVHRKSQNQPYHRSYMSVPEQLRYKYILSIEGNDVATNLKWIMASQSVCLMTHPKYETWLMEGRLQPEVHYIGLEDDYSDLDEKLRFYKANPQAAEKIVQQAQQWMQPFFDAKLERIVSLMVMQKYFDCCQK